MHKCRPPVELGQNKMKTMLEQYDAEDVRKCRTPWKGANNEQ